MIERDFDIPFVAEMALREKQIQQNYRPIIAVHKWFARRPGTLFRALLLSEFARGRLRETYFKPNDLRGIRVADPFMGGGTPLLEANRLGCDIIGHDINPMAHWVVRQEIERLDLSAYRSAAQEFTDWLKKKVGRFYRTKCFHCGSTDAHAKYFLWVKTQICRECDREVDLFPGYVLAKDQRHPTNVFVCPKCGELNEAVNLESPGHCRSCKSALSRQGPARRRRFLCPHCGRINSYPHPEAGPPGHRMFAIEYHCPSCKPQHKGRFFKKPDGDDLAKYGEARSIWVGMSPEFVPDDEIPCGDETDRLHRWGYQHYREMFNERQLLGLELSCQAISRVSDERVRNALATNLSDLLRYQNMLCRYDTMSLKSLDIFSVHGFPVGLVQCESNLLGISNRIKGTSIGSGGWSNIVEKYTRAKAYCDNPFEIKYQNGKKVQVIIPGEWIGDRRNGAQGIEQRDVSLQCKSATLVGMAPASLDAVLTDPPYFGNVQYAELMDFCYVWLRRLVGGATDGFQSSSTRNVDELTGNVTMSRGLPHFTTGLADVFSKMARALKAGAPLVFTYHHNKLEAYLPVAVAILDAGLTCSASMPCPAEMGGSIHISGTKSSIVDTIFVCRSTGKVPRRWIVSAPEEIAGLVLHDIRQLKAGNVKPTRGDIRCILFGHLVRLAIWELRLSWDRTRRVEDKLSAVAQHIKGMTKLSAIEESLERDLPGAPSLRRAGVRENKAFYGECDGEVSF